MTPKEWKNGGYKEYSNKIIEKISISNDLDFSNIEPTIVKMPQMRGYYIRHKGYDKSIKKNMGKTSNLDLYK